MFTLLALLICFLGANAKTVVDAEVDFSKYSDISEWNFPYSWGGSDEAKARLSIQNGCLHFESSEVTMGQNDAGEMVEQGWRCQFFPIGGVNAEVGTVYTLHYKIKGDHAENVSMLGFGLTPYGQFPITTDWVEGTVDYEATSADGNILMQCGSYIGTWDIAYLKITHEERDNQRPKEWIPLLENGDAEKSWADPNVRFNDPDNNYKICAWGKEKNVNLNENGGWDPFPATIEDDGTGNHVFVVHGKIADTPKDGDQDPSAWDNQFWIQAPRQLKAGELLKIHFKYKASEAANTNTQMHHQTPSDYMHWQCLGDVAFTTEWQEFDKEISWPSGGDDKGWSIAFNLNPDNKNAVDFYFDDLQISELKLDHGWFVAGQNKDNGLSYNFDNAIELQLASGEIEWTNPQTGKTISVDVDGTYVGTVGEKGKPDTWVKEVMISTVRGHDGTFKSSTIKPTGTVTGLDPDDWKDYGEASGAAISLPAAGAWLISVAPADAGKQVLFLKIDGEENADPLEEIANPTLNVVEGVEREPTATEQPADEEAGIAAGTGQPWDNQFFILANREIKTGESVTLKFKYKSSINAKTTTQLHGDPGAYIYWNAIGDVNFTTEWQDFEKTWEIPHGDNNAEISFKSIAFNMAEIKEACTYEIKDVIWMTEDHMETLIDTEGDKNFYVKVGAGTAPYVVSGIESVVNDSKVSNVTYNLAGQRVSKGYKGIVIKNGAKYIAK